MGCPTRWELHCEIFHSVVTYSAEHVIRDHGGLQPFNKNMCNCLSKNPFCSHKWAYWKKRFCEITCMIHQNIHEDWWGQKLVKEASYQQKLYTILLAWPWKARKSLFHFHSLNGKCVTCFRLQCGRCIKKSWPFSWQNCLYR